MSSTDLIQKYTLAVMEYLYTGVITSELRSMADEIFPSGNGMTADGAFRLPLNFAESAIDAAREQSTLAQEARFTKEDSGRDRRVFTITMPINQFNLESQLRLYPSITDEDKQNVLWSEIAAVVERELPVVFERFINDKIKQCVLVSSVNQGWQINEELTGVDLYGMIVYLNMIELPVFRMGRKHGTVTRHGHWKWFVNSNTMLQAATLKDPGGNYIVDERSISMRSVGIPDELIDIPVVFNEWQDDIEAGAIPLVLINTFNREWCEIVMSTSMHIRPFQPGNSSHTIVLTFYMDIKMGHGKHFIPMYVRQSEEITEVVNA